MKILVTGKDGQLGYELQKKVKEEGYGANEYMFTGRSELDLNNGEQITRILADYKPDLVVHCAAFTAVDGAEEQSDLAFRINRDATAHLADAAAERDAKFIYISTDFVFNGEKNRAYTEEDEIEPVCVYGESKAAGEEVLRKSGADHLILRTSWVFSSHGSNFVKTIVRFAAERESLNVVCDQIGAPTYAADLAGAILYFIRNSEMIEGSDTYHFCNSGVSSWYDLACEAVRLKNLNCNLIPVRTEEYATAAERPVFSLLDNRKYRDRTGLPVRHWREALAEMTGRLT